MHSLLDAGSKSISHLEKLLDKFAPLLARVAPDSAGHAALVAATVRYWDAAPQLVIVALQKLLRHGAIDSAAIVSFLFSPPERRRRLAQLHSWELLYAIVEATLAQQRACADALRLDERRAAEAARDGGGDDDDMDDGSAPGSAAAARVARSSDALDRARQDKKALFANLFAGAGAAMGEAAAAAAAEGGGAPPLLWHATTIMHMRATGRRYLRELSLKTLEIIVEGAELDAATQAQIFDPLKQLAAYLG